jgi:hypothetical protein
MSFVGPSTLRFVVLSLASLGVLGGCAVGSCVEDEECGGGAYCGAGRCRRDCRTDEDCDTGEVCASTRRCVDPSFDGGVDAGTDAAVPGDGGLDTPTPPPDTGGTDVGGSDAGSDTPAPTLGRYLDRCVEDADCMTGRCVDSVGGTRMCTITCSGHSECASEHVCASGVCRLDDTGTICSAASGCVLGLCAGNPATGTGECTRPCSSASDCPAGYACSDAGGVNICVNIERSCAVCPTGLCLSPQGCTSTCRTAADCPTALTGMSYTCQIVGGSDLPVCVASPLIVGADPIGAPCRMSGASNLCRSGTCITDDDSGSEYCTQRCTESGGCGPGFGCAPVDDGGGGALLVCVRAGSGALGASCTTGGNCDSGICDPADYCTRLCTADTRCPSDMTCGVGPAASCER